LVIIEIVSKLFAMIISFKYKLGYQRIRLACRAAFH